MKNKVGAAGFEPAKAYATRFTVWPIWPLWNTPAEHLKIHDFPRKDRRTYLAASEERGKIASDFADVKQTERFFLFGC